MGKVKAMAMDNEDKWFDIANSIIGGCECLGEFTQQMERYRHLMAHYNVHELHEISHEAWGEYWSEYNVR